MAKEKFVRFRVNESEHEDLVKKSKELGFENYSDYLRALVWDLDLVKFKIKQKGGK